jgi:hypothetical protein
MIKGASIYCMDVMVYSLEIFFITVFKNISGKKNLKE